MSSESFNFSELIALKQNGDILTHDQMEYFVKAVCTKSIHDAQIGAMLMAIFLRGMTREETVSLTNCMKKSGEVLSWPDEWKHLVVDKHSTGGVGDKISLVLAPALAACGLKVPMISGRSLGFTGGTLDKLEAIPNFNVTLSSQDMKNVLESVGCCIVGQTELLVPADKVLYALRDITNTVASAPLIVSSIISKKTAESLKCLVLDVKYGKGSFQKTVEDAERLAHLLVATSDAIGVEATAFVTEMEEPLGNTIGNSIEVLESIECLQGKGPQDIIELVINQGAELLHLSRRVTTFEAGKEEISKVLNNGEALEKFKKMLIAQGVNEEDSVKLCQNPKNVLPFAKHSTTLTAIASGVVTAIDALACAYVSAALGACRSKPGDKVTHDTGLELFVKTGDSIEKGKPWITVYHREEILAEGLKKQLEDAITVSDNGCACHGSKIHSKISAKTPKTIMVCQ